MKFVVRKMFLAGLITLLATSSFAQINFSRYVSSGTDDAEENAPGTTGGTVGAMDLTSSDVELMVDGTKQQFIGVRFTNVNIPNGATITGAYIQFTTKGDKNPVSGTITIKGEDVDNSSTFTSANFNISTRTTTSQSVSWAGSTSSTWGTSGGGTRGTNQQTASLTTIVQHLVNRTGWASGNAMAFIFSGMGVRNAYTYDGSTTYAPELRITYTNPPIPMSIINFPIPKYSEWYYLDNGSDQGTGWIPQSFDHSNWQYGPGKLGYSDNPATTISYGPDANNKYITYYFRKQFNVASVSALTDTLVLSILRDDGAVVYINGTEVVRDNMPSGTITYTTWSVNITDGGNESTYFDFRIPKSVLVNGQNTIAVEVHQRDGTSSDVGFDLELKEEPVPSIIRGPYLQKATSSSMNVRWRTDAPGGSVVYYGTHPDSLNSYVSDSLYKMNHELEIAGLSPRTKYWYKVATTVNTLQGDTNNYFQTLPVPGAKDLYRIGVIGDCGNNSTNQANVRNQLINYLGSNYMDSWILLGDNAYSSGTDNEYQAEFFNIYKDRFLKQNPLFPAPGNHDYSNGSSTAQDNHQIPYYDIFTMPTNGECGGTPSGNEAYYSFDIGNVHFLSLDSYGEEDAGTTRLYDTLGAQVQWIKNDLQNNTNKDWIVAYWHHPPYTKGSHNSDTENELVKIRENFIKILERYGVDLILCGHSHDYERSKLMKGHFGNEASFNATQHHLSTSTGIYDGSANSCPYIKDSATNYEGTVYVVSGSAGQLGGTTSGYPHNAMQYSNASNGGSMILEVQGNRLDAKWICADGVIRDKFTMMKDVNVVDTLTVFSGQPDTLQASWTGTYAWNTGATTQQITIAPTMDTLIEVKDNNTGTCLTDQHLVNVVDSPSIISATGDITTTTAVLSCDTAVTYSVVASGIPAPVMTYTFSGATTGSGNGTGSGSLFNKGTTMVTVSAVNAYGTADTTFAVEVNDIYLPTISAPADITTNSDNGSCFAAINLGTPATSDNCGTVTVTNDAPTDFPVGNTTVTWTATDATGNAATATQLVTVTDTEVPVVTAPATVVVNSDAGQCYATGVALGTPTIVDNCTMNTVVNDAPMQFNPGSTTVTWTVTDQGGNIATATQTVIVHPSHTQWTGAVDSLWSNPANWDCQVLPDISTDVTINNAVPFMPVVNTTTAACNHLLISTGAQVGFTGTGNVLEVHGDITANGQFNAGNGRVVLSGSNSQSIPGGTYENLDVEGGSTKMLTGNITVSNTLTLTNGYLQLGNYDLVLLMPASVTGGNAQSFIITDASGQVTGQNMGNGGTLAEVLFPVGADMTSYTPVAVGNTGTLDNYSIRVINGVFAHYNGHTPDGANETGNAVNKTWFISEGLSGGSVASVKPFWNAADELPVFDRNVCYVSHYDTATHTWQPGPAGNASLTTPFAHVMNVTSFSPFGVGSASSPLDIRLLSFTAALNEGAVRVEWATASEQNIIGYEVERSVDGKIFTKIGTQQANGYSENKYTHTDAEALSLGVEKLYYRLAVKNNDGSHAFSKIASVTIPADGNSVVITPNPVSGKELVVMMQGSVASGVEFSIIDMQGKEISSYQLAPNSYEPNAIKLNVSGLAAGTYMLRVKEGSRAIRNIKFTKN